MKTSTLFKAALAAASLAGAMAAHATPIVGKLNMNPLFLVQVFKDNIDWNPPSNYPFDTAPTYGNFGWNVGGNTGSFTGSSFALPNGVDTGLKGQLHDLSNDPSKTGNYFPVGSGFLSKVVTFANEPNWIFDAYSLAPGYEIAPGVYLPYQLTELGGNLFANITITGLACDAGADGVCDATDDVTKFTLALSAQYTGLTIAQAVSTLNGGGALENNSWSGVLTATLLPEPASVALVGAALAGLGFVSRRRRAK